MRENNVIVRGNLVYVNISGKWCVYDQSKEPLGSGAMGTVFYGYICESKTPVAIKKVKEVYSNDQNIRNRARQEASLIFGHRNLVEMLGFCESEYDNGPIFIVSKYVHGENFDKFVQTKLGTLPHLHRIKTICGMVMPIFDALNYLHSNNILHMDIKPSNIMVENGNNIRLMDLGIAYTDAYQMSNTSNMMGTPKYAAPEQFGLKGTRETIDNRTDIYELSVTIYELLCNNNPFASQTFDELIEKHKNLLLPYNKDIPKPIVEVLRKAAHPEKQQRYRNIVDFKNDFRKATNELNEKKNVSYTRTILFFILISLLLLIIGLIIYLI